MVAYENKHNPFKHSTSLHIFGIALQINLILIPTSIMKFIIKMLRKYAVIELGFVVLTTYLLYRELYGFFVTKPTYSSSSKLMIGGSKICSSFYFNIWYGYLNTDLCNCQYIPNIYLEKGWSKVIESQQLFNYKKIILYANLKS